MKEKYSDEHYKLAKNEWEIFEKQRDKFNEEHDEIMAEIIASPKPIPSEPIFSKDKMIRQLKANIVSVRMLMYKSFLYTQKEHKKQGRIKIKRYIKEIREIQKSIGCNKRN